MKTRPLFLLFLTLSFSAFAYAQSAKSAGPHVPAAGSTERQVILDALRGDQAVKFKVHFVKVHDGWCWIDTTPLDKDGHATAEGGPNLLHLEDGKWKVMDLAPFPQIPTIRSEPKTPAPAL
jgi:hypothetical protein